MVVSVAIASSSFSFLLALDAPQTETVLLEEDFLVAFLRFGVGGQDSLSLSLSLELSSRLFEVM